MQKVFLKLDEINGESQNARQIGEIEVSSFTGAAISRRIQPVRSTGIPC